MTQRHDKAKRKQRRSCYHDGHLANFPWMLLKAIQSSKVLYSPISHRPCWQGIYYFLLEVTKPEFSGSLGRHTVKKSQNGFQTNVERGLVHWAAAPPLTPAPSCSVPLAEPPLQDPEAVLVLPRWCDTLRNVNPRPPHRWGLLTHILPGLSSIPL